MADTTHDLEIKHNLDEYAQKIKESNDLWDAHFAKVKAVNDELTKLFNTKFTDSMMAAMGQAKYDFTSPAYLARKILGINPKNWSDPAAMAEGTILSVQKQLKTYAPEKMLALAHSRGFGDLGLSDQDLIRLYTGSQKDVNDLVKKAQGAAPSLDQSAELQQKYKDLQTDIDLTGARLRAMGEDILSNEIPKFREWADALDDMIDKYRGGGAPSAGPGSGRVPTPYSELGPGFWNGDFGSTPGGKYAFPGAGYGPGRSPSGAPKGSANDPVYVKPADLSSTYSDSGAFVGGLLGAAGGAPNYTGYGGVGSGGGGKGAYGPIGPQGSGAPGSKPDTGGTAVTSPGEAGLYRPVYHLSDKDLSDKVVHTIAGEAKAFNAAGTDAVIDNMMNRLGTHTYGPSGNLEEVARAKNQYTGWRVPDAKEAEFIRSRIKAIASGGLPDITGGSNEYRASWYHGPWGWNHPEGINVGGNVFAYNAKGGLGPYAATKGGVGGINPLYMGDSRAIGMSMAGPKGEVTGVTGQNPNQVLDQIRSYKNSMAGRDIYLSPGTANMMGKGGWDQGAFDKTGIPAIDAQLATLKAKGADMSRVHILGVPGGYGGDYANQKMAEEAKKYGAAFKALKSQELHPAKSGYKEMFDEPSASKSAAPGPMSMNNSRLWQMDKGMHVKVSNPAGADVNIQSAMLGALKGQYG